MPLNFGPEGLLRLTWTARRANQSIVREINPEYSLEGLMLKLKLQYFSHLMWTISLEKSLMLGKIEGGRRRRHHRMRWLDGISNAMDIRSDQIRSLTQSCPTLCDPMNRSTPGLPVHHQLPEFTQTCPLSRWCHLTISSLSSPSPPVFNLSQYQGLFKWVSSSHQSAKILEFQL